jgi:hypothetical protein
VSPWVRHNQEDTTFSRPGSGGTLGLTAVPREPSVQECA